MEGGHCLLRDLSCDENAFLEVRGNENLAKI